MQKNKNKNLNLKFLQFRKSENNNLYFVSNGLNTVEVPKIAVEILKLFDGKKSIKKINEIIDSKHKTHINVAEFIENLKNAGILYNQTIKVNPKIKNAGYIFNKIIYSYPSIIFYIILISISICLCSRNIGNYFNYNFIFISKNITLSMLVYFLLSWVSVGEHELTHYLCASGYNLSSTIKLGTRLQFLVAQTNINNPYSVSKYKRFKIYTVGILTDAIIASICILLITFSSNIFFISILRCLLFIKIIGILWQFLFYMKTDVYFDFTTLFSEYNLMNDAENYIKNKNETRNIVKFFSYFLMLGRTISILYFTIFSLPLIYLSITKAIKTPNLIDKSTSLFVLSFGWILFIYTFFKNRKKKSNLD